MTEQEVIERLREAAKTAGGLRRFAKAHGFSAAYISDVLRGRRTLSERILATIGVRREVLHIVSYREEDNNVT